VCISAPLSEEDRGALIGREQRRLARLEAELQRLAAKLSNPNFAEKAPAAVIEKTRAQGAELTRQVEALRARLASLERTSS
jgi:valyl-tRNA synthetase